MKYDSEMLDKAIWNCQQAYRMCQKGTEDAQTIKAQLDDLTNFKRWSEAWDEMNTTIENELENHNTTGAINCLKSYYRKFENNEYDYWYWSKLFHIYEEEAHSLVDGGTEKDYDAVIDKLETALLNMKDMTDGDEDRIASCETNQETINNIKEFRLYAVTMFKIEEHLDKKEFQKATDVLEAYNSNDSCAYGFYYWMKTFRINRIKAEDSIENGKDISAELKVMENALRRANDLAQRDNDQGQLEIVKGASKLLDDLTNANKTRYETSVHNSSSSNSKEQEYLEEVQACLADDGVITERERRLLDRLRKSLGISEARAAELEAMCNPQSFTAEEQEYADEVKACLQDDGVITSKERRLLERLAKSLGISKDRATQIEEMIVK